MSNYTITTDFGAKDDLPSGNASKVIKGSEFTTEFTNIKTAVNSKADSDAPTFTGATTFNGTVTLNDDVTFDTNTMFVDVSTNRVGIGTTSPATALDVTGVITADGLTSSAGIDVTGVITTDGLTSSAGIDVTGNVSLNDNGKALFGDGNDLEIYHDGSNSYIHDTGTGGLYIRGSDEIALRSLSNENIFLGLTDGSAYVYHDGSVKLQTTSTGVDVTGTVTADGLTVAGDINFYEDTGTTPKLTWDSSAEQFIAKDGAFLKVTETDSSTVAAQLKSDSDEGLLQLYYGGTEKVRVRTNADSYFNGGNVGIGTSSPLKDLNVSNVTGSSEIMISTSDTGTGSLEFGDVTSGAVARGFLKYNHTDNSLQLGSAQTEAMRIASDGNVGIGTDSPASNLHVSSSGDTIARITSADGSGAFLDLGDASDPDGGRIVYDSGSNLALYTASTERMRIDSSGNVGIGTTNPSYPLDIAGASGTTLSVRNTSTVSSILLSNGSSANQIFSRGANSSTGRDLAFVQGTSEAMRIDSSGNVLVGTTSTAISGSGSRFFSGGNAAITSAGTPFEINRLTADGNIIAFKKDGTTVGSISVTASATAYNTSSDERLKENIADSADAGSKIDAIQIRQFDWKSDGSHQDYGVIAQELVEVAPEAVSEGETEDDMMSVDYSKLVPTLIKEIQTLRNRVAQLENN